MYMGIKLQLYDDVDDNNSRIGHTNSKLYIIHLAVYIIIDYMCRYMCPGRYINSVLIRSRNVHE